MLLSLLKRNVLPDAKARVAFLSIVSNSFLTTIKIVVGVMIGSVSVISEGIHSGLDLIAAVIAYVSVRTSGRPPDEKHRYGHGKIENVSGTIEALLIFIAALWIIREAYEKIIHGTAVEMVSLGLLVMALSVVINIFVSSFLFKTARKYNSIALEADALHLRTDVYTSLGVFLGLLAIKITGIQILDPIIAIGVALLIMKAAYDLTKKAFNPLIDSAIPPEEEREIVRVLEGMKADNELIGYHKLRTRLAGPERHIDMHLVVMRCHSIQKTHQLCDAVERNIKNRLGKANIVIHPEPCHDEHCGECNSRSSVPGGCSACDG